MSELCTSCFFNAEFWFRGNAVGLSLTGVPYSHEADSNADGMALSRKFMAKDVHQQAAPEIGLT